MREFKFRMWSKEYKTMFSHEKLMDAAQGAIKAANYAVDKLGYERNKPIPDGIFLPLTDDDAVIMQYTGLKDKNGNEIYEGDILRLWGGKGNKGQLRREYAKALPVEYCDLWCQFVVVDKPNKMQYGIWENFAAYEVVGNIYEDGGETNEDT